MKGILILFAAFGVIAADNPSVQTDESMEARTVRRIRETNVAITLERPNELTVGNLTLDGVAILAVRADNPLQLVNPFAPAEYGRAEDNVTWDPVSGKASGLKLFSIKF